MSRCAWSSLTISCALLCGGCADHGAANGSRDGGAGTDGATSTDVGTGTGVGVWTDAPGACPAGTTRVDITNVSDLENATRGEGAFTSTGAGTCLFLHDGTYTQNGGTLPVYFKRGGAAGNPIYLVGESRDGAVIKGRGAIDAAASHVVISNLTFDLNGYSQSGSFNTLSLYASSDLTVSHVTFTGDCNTGLKGGHVETNGTHQLLVDSCIIEKFGHCGGGGHEDHGVYLAGGDHLTIRNNVIRGNSSRGIQFYTAAGQNGTLDQITVERNLIEANGHADYEDGIVLNGSGTGTVSNVTIQRNVFYQNHFSGIRFTGPATSAITVAYNTFVQNGNGAEIFADGAGNDVGATISKNIFAVGATLINNCYDGASHAFALSDNVVHGNVAAASCVSGTVLADPAFANAAGGDFTPTNAQATAYGAYAP